MKIQILQLESSDDRASVSDRLNWAQAPRVLLVWPPSGRVLTRRLDLVLLQRLARRRGAQLGLVTHDPEVLDLASELGIPTFDTPDAAGGDGWRRGRVTARSIARRHPPPDLAALRPASAPPRRLYRMLRWPLFILAVASPLAIAFALLPSATIYLPLSTAAQDTELTLLLDPALTSPDLSGRIPALTVRTRLRQELRVPTTGTALVPADPARGTVLFTNLTDNEEAIPEGTGLRASAFGGMRFLTEESVVVPAGRGSTASASIVAEDPGSQGNLPAGSIDSLEGSLGLLLRVTNPSPTSGGLDTARPAVALADRTRLLRDATSLLLQNAEAELEATLDPGTDLAAGSLRIVREHVRAYDGEVGQPTDSVGLTLEADVAGLAYRWADVEASARAALQASFPRWVEATGSLEVRPLSPPSTDSSGQTRLFLLARRRAAEMPGYLDLLPQLLGRTPAEVASLLQSSLSLDRQPTIEVHPSWWPRMPLLTVRIRVLSEWGD